MDNIEKFDLIKKCFISQDFILVKMFGFKLIKVDENERVEITFQKLDREVEIVFSPLNEKREVHDLIAVYINKIPCKVANDTFSIEEYLRHNNLEGFSKNENIVSPNNYYDFRRQQQVLFN